MEQLKSGIAVIKLSIISLTSHTFCSVVWKLLQRICDPHVDSTTSEDYFSWQNLFQLSLSRSCPCNVQENWNFWLKIKAFLPLLASSTPSSSAKLANFCTMRCTRDKKAVEKKLIKEKVQWRITTIIRKNLQTSQVHGYDRGLGFLTTKLI